MSNLEPVCPYCTTTLEQKPQRKKKCPHCKKHIYVKTLPSTREKVLVTESEAAEIELQWQQINFSNKWKSDLEQYGISEKAYIARKAEFSKQFEKNVSDRDVIWSFFNELVSKTKNLHELKMLYYQMAIFLNEIGKDFFQLLRKARKLELLYFKEQGVVQKVQILTAGDNSCKFCQKLEKKVFTIEEALEKMPLPCKECTFKIYDENRGFCRCLYVAKIDL